LVQNIEEVLSQDLPHRKLQNWIDRPLPISYQPEIDVSLLLDAMLTTRFQMALGVLCWFVELGQLDIMTEVSMLSANNTTMRRSYGSSYYIFSYLKGHENSRVVFDPAYANIDDWHFKDCDWSNFYSEAVDEEAPGMPPPWVLPVEITCFVDADHAGNLLTCHSQSGVLIFINPIIWYSKRQNMVESSTFGSEFVVYAEEIE